MTQTPSNDSQPAAETAYRNVLQELDQRVEVLNNHGRQPAQPEQKQTGLCAYIRRNLQSRIVQFGAVALLAFGAATYYQDNVRTSYKAVAGVFRQGAAEQRERVQEFTIDQATDLIIAELRKNPQAAAKYQGKIDQAFGALPKETQYRLLLEGVRGMDAAELNEQQLREIREVVMQSKLLYRILTLPNEKQKPKKETPAEEGRQKGDQKNSQSDEWEEEQ